MSAIAVAPVGLAFDAQLPFRDEYLDPAIMIERVAGIVGLPDGLVIERCVLRRVKYRLGETLRVLYEFDVNGCRHVLTARAFPASDVPKPSLFIDIGTHTCECGVSLRKVSFDPIGNAVWWAFPTDRNLAHLAEVIAPSPEWTNAHELGWVRSELAEYRPEHSVTIRCLGSRNRTVGFAKTYANGSMGELLERYNRVATGLAEQAGLRSPRALWWSEPQHTLMLEAMPGTPWSEQDTATLPETLEALGRAIAIVHELPAHDLPRFDRLDTDRVTHCAELIAVARPDVANLCRELNHLLRGGPPATTSAPVFLHGDVHPKNALQSANGIALLDFDQAGIGPAAADVASLIAVLRHGAIVNPDGPFANVDQLGASFLHGYESIRAHSASFIPGVQGELPWFTAAALVAERAMRAVNRVNRASLAQLPAILTYAIDILQGATP
jgi:aminoglycoside phosphotransferase